MPTRNFAANDRQKEVYVTGLSGRKPLLPVGFAALEARAKDAMSPKAFAYVAGGAGEESTMQENRSAFDRWKILPRMLRDVSQLDTAIEIFGQKLPSPFLLAPIGVLELAHEDADLAVAKAAATAGVPMIFSNQASIAMEKTAAVMGESPRWFQLYWSKSNELVASFVKRAEVCGCSAIVVTLDTTMLGWRTRDLDLAYLPFLQGKGIAQYTTDPIFNTMLDEPADSSGSPVAPPKNMTTIGNVLSLMQRYPGSFWENLRTKRPLKAVQQFINIYSRPSLAWEDLPFLQRLTRLPILLKGILHPGDACKAIEMGVAGIVVSNHGGRQVDGSVATLEALPAIVEAVGGKIPVLMDSGIRGGADVFKALALGASAVLLGRPYVYGLALAGEQGVLEVMKNLMADFELTMGLAGYKRIGEIDSGCLIRSF
jgi:lactate 2-monooxygenase